MPVIQSNVSDYGLGSYLVQSSSQGTSIYGMSGNRCSAGIRPPLFVPGDLHYWDGLRDSEGSPNFTVLDNGIGRIPMDWVGTVLICDSRGPSLVGVWPRTLRTEV